LDIKKIARCLFSGLKWTCIFLVFSYALHYALGLLMADGSSEWPTLSTVGIAVVLFASSVWREWSGWEKTWKLTMVRRSLGEHLLRGLGAYCICVGASIAMGCLLGGFSLLCDSTLWIIVVAGLPFMLLSCWLDWRKARRDVG